MEYNVAVVGEVDASKSTLIGVLSSGKLDDGRGEARENVLSLKHEKESGRTSNVNTVLTTITAKDKSTDIRFLDLAGHEKYIKTTLKGLTSYYPNYALLLVAANRNVTKTTVEHYKACYRLNIPIIICITKIDITPPDILKQTMLNIKRLCRPKNGKIFTYDMKDDDTMARAVKTFNEKPCGVIPYFKISNVTGYGLDMLKEFLTKIQPDIMDPSIDDFMKESNVKKLFLVYKPYYVNGIGFVVFGKNYGDPISQRDTLLIGPINNEYQRFVVKSIHNAKRELITTMNTGESGCLAMTFKKFQPTKELLKGVVILDEPIYVTRFIAEIIIGEHSTTIKVGYKPFVNCGPVATIAKVIGLYETNPYSKDSNEPNPDVKQLNEMRIDNHGFIEFSFSTSQFMMPNSTIAFRDGSLKGTGVVCKTFAK